MPAAVVALRACALVHLGLHPALLLNSDAAMQLLMMQAAGAQAAAQAQAQVVAQAHSAAVSHEDESSDSSGEADAAPGQRLAPPAAAPMLPEPVQSAKAAARAAALARWQAKRSTRSFAKVVRYEMRTREAATRPREHGRFMKKATAAVADSSGEADAAPGQRLAPPAAAGPPPVPVQSAKAAARASALARWQAKRSTRSFAKVVRYEMRTREAATRPREHGRFMKKPTAAAAAER